MIYIPNNLPFLNPGDVIVAKKRQGLGRILNHYIVYVGNNTFVGNWSEGVKELSHHELMKLLQDYEPTNIRRLNGTIFQQRQAISKAYSKLGQKYSLLNFNCEHFANWVQFAKSESIQVATGMIMLVAILCLKIMNSDE